MIPVQIKTKAIAPALAEKYKESLQALASNIDLEALQILAKKSKQKGISKKIIDYQDFL
jgi:hypothetical protein